MATLTLDAAAIEQLFDAPFGPVGNHMKRIGDRTRTVAQSLAGRRSGALRNSIRSILTLGPQGIEAHIGSALPYAAVHHEGSRPHIIRARRAASLHFFWERVGGLETFVPRAGTRGGRTFLTRRGGSLALVIGKGFVNHPGTSANRYLLDAATLAIRELS